MSEDHFGVWLLMQRHRNDPVGDLARDFGSSGGPAGSPDAALRHLIAGGAQRGARAAFDQALAEWNSL